MSGEQPSYPPAVDVFGVDERNVGDERRGGNLVVFVYEAGDEPSRSWSVDSYLLVEADLPGALAWLTDHLPVGCCWSLGVVRGPDRPTTESELTIDWLIGADVLNVQSGDRSSEEQRLADEMLARRHRLTLT